MVIFNSYVKLPEGILRNKQCHGVSENGVIDLQIMMSWQIHRECDQNIYHKSVDLGVSYFQVTQGCFFFGCPTECFKMANMSSQLEPLPNNSSLLKMAIEIVDLSEFTHWTWWFYIELCGSLPEGSSLALKITHFWETHLSSPMTGRVYVDLPEGTCQNIL